MGTIGCGGRRGGSCESRTRESAGEEDQEDDQATYAPEIATVAQEAIDLSVQGIGHIENAFSYLLVGDLHGAGFCFGVSILALQAAQAKCRAGPLEIVVGG